MNQELKRVLTEGTEHEVRMWRTRILKEMLTEEFSQEDWAFVGSIGALAYKAGGGFSDDELATQKTNLVSNLGFLGLLSGRPEKRWQAWMAGRESGIGSESLFFEENDYPLWLRDNIGWPSRLRLVEASRWWGRDIMLVPNTAQDVKIFLESTDRRERELGIRLLAELGFAENERTARKILIEPNA